jgi:hypothetical protein
MRAILLAALLPVLACAQSVTVQLSGAASGKSEAGPPQKIVQFVQVHQMMLQSFLTTRAASLSFLVLDLLLRRLSTQFAS